MVQTVIAIIVVACAVAVLVYKGWKIVRDPGCGGCGSDCNVCGENNKSEMDES